MVFRGKPSKACWRCRQRRLKCDLQPVSCSSCIRANQVCRGYRDVSKLRVVNETPSARHGTLTKYADTPWSLQQPVELQARDAFFAHYVTGTSSRGWDFLMASQGPALEPVNICIDAVSLAFIAHQQASPSLMNFAQVQYSVALRSVNRVLSRKEYSVTRSLLTASLLLDLFEKITNSGPGSMEFWHTHVNGSLALIEAVGLQNLEDHVSLRTLARFVTNCITSCVASATAVPAQVYDICAHLARNMRRDGDAKWKMSLVMMQFASWRESVRLDIGSLHERVAMAKLLDEALLKLSSGTFDQWQAQNGVAVGPTSYGSGRCLLYRDRHVTQTWNVGRLNRIMLNEFLLESCFNFHTKDEDAECATCGTAVQAIISMTDDICRTVYQYAGGCCNYQRSDDQSVIQARVHRRGAHSPTQSLDCYTLLFPLFTAGRSQYTLADQKLWIVQCLNFINDHFGIKNAVVLADMIERRTERDPWKVYAMLGGYGFAT